jgi:hypothetical protein
VRVRSAATLQVRRRDVAHTDYNDAAPLAFVLPLRVQRQSRLRVGNPNTVLASERSDA